MTKQKTEDVVWVERNYTLLRSYLYENFPDSYEQRNYVESLFQDWNNAKHTRTILEDFTKSNSQKYSYFLKKFLSQSLIVSIVADRGQGKTAFSIKILEDLSKRKKIYALYPFPKLPFIEIVFDITEVPDDSILYIDELGKKYKARDFQSEEAIALTDELIGLRHRNISVIGATQDVSLVDINYLRLSDVLIWKSYNVEKSELTREGFINEVIKTLMPKRGQINNVLVNDRGEISTFTYDFSSYSQDVSKYLSNLKNDKEKIIRYLSSYYSTLEISKVLYTQYGIKLSIEEKNKLGILTDKRKLNLN